MSKPGIPKKQRTAAFAVDDIVLSGQTYSSASNHDPDGDSDGTSIAVNKP